MGRGGLPLFERKNTKKESGMAPHNNNNKVLLVYICPRRSLHRTPLDDTWISKKKRRGEDGGTKEENRRLLRPRFLGRFDDV